MLPTVGVKCYSWTLDTVGLFAAGVDDVARGLSAMTGRPELLLPSSIPTPRIGIVTQDFAGAPEAAGAEALRIATKAAERAGASVRALALPEIIAEAWRVHPVIQEFEAHQALAWEYRENYDAMAPHAARHGSTKAREGHRPTMTRPWMLRAARGMRSPKYSKMSM